jgi:hypothetical protein
MRALLDAVRRNTFPLAGGKVVTELPRPAAEPLARGWLARSLTFIERVGNALPHPGTLFALMAVLVVIVSAITAQLDIVVTHPGTLRRSGRSI